MPLYVYKAVARDGTTVEDRREASDEQTLVRGLQEEGLIPVRVQAANVGSLGWLSLKSAGKKRLRQKDILRFTRELATLLSAGLPLDRALSTLRNLAPEGEPLHQTVQDVLEMVKGGKPLSDALEAQDGGFTRFYLNMVRAGEASGALEHVLERLSEHLEKSRELRDSVGTALIYPAILAGMAVLSLLLMLTFVVPQFTEMFETAEKELPLPTQIVVAIADGLRSYWWALLVAVILGVGILRFQLAESHRRYRLDRMLLRLPLVGGLLLRLEVARFARTMATMLSNGVPLLNALSITRETVGNRVLMEKIGDAVSGLKQGTALSKPLADSGFFPEVAIQMIKLGEETGRLPEMLERVATTYDQEIRVQIQRLLALLEPALIVTLGLAIGGIIVSILMAILSVNDLAF